MRARSFPSGLKWGDGMDQVAFEDAHDALANDFSDRLDAATGAEEAGALLLQFILERERLRRGVVDPGPIRDAVDQETMAALASPDRLGPEHSLREVVLRRLVIDPTAAARYLEGAIQDRSDTQSRRASNPRPGSRDSITRLIEEILEENPSLPAKQVGRLLEHHPDIQLMGDEYRHIRDASTLRVGNLDSRVSDARRRVSGQPG
jgi:hypothetical protein